tara:strand:- start:93 stop:926 length:834 start_codon:yes stop_codon:yes gene_type:complete
VKLKHNKKRNTAFLYETLIKELTKATIKKNEQKKGRLVALIKEHFDKSTLLRKELELYRALHDDEVVTPYTAEKLIFEARRKYTDLDKKELFREQTTLINKMNKIFSKSIFSNFIPNYKNLATINQIFDDDISIKKRVILEENLISRLSKKSAEKEDLKPIDSLVYKTFIEKFNKEYSGKLFAEQKELLSKYISFFANNGLELKMYLNEEIGRLKHVIQESLNTEEIKNDSEMIGKTKEVLELLEGFQLQTIDSKMIKKVLQVQSLIKELELKENDN